MMFEPDEDLTDVTDLKPPDLCGVAGGSAESGPRQLGVELQAKGAAGAREHGSGCGAHKHEPLQKCPRRSFLDRKK